MTTFQPQYISYRKRIIHETWVKFLFAIVILITLIYLSSIKEYLLLLLIPFSAFVIPVFYPLLKYSRKYLKSIIINSSQVEILIVDRNIELPLLKSNLKDTRIRISKTIWDSTRWAKNYKLQIDIKQNGKFETIFEQHELGKWDLNIFKEIYTSYCKSINIPLISIP